MNDLLKELPGWIPWIVAIGVAVGWFLDRIRQWRAFHTKNRKDTLDLLKAEIVELQLMLDAKSAEISRMKGTTNAWSQESLLEPIPFK